MLLLFLTKIICFISYYFIFAISFFEQTNVEFFGILFLLIIVSSSLLYIGKNNSGYKFIKLSALLLPLSIYFVSGVSSVVVSLFPILLLYYIVKNKEFEIDYEGFKFLFFRLSLAMAVFSTIYIAATSLDRYLNSNFIYVCTFLLSGVHLMRTSRHSEEVIVNRKFMYTNLLFLIATILVCILFGSEIISKLTFQVLSFIYLNSFYHILVLIAYIIAITFSGIYYFLLLLTRKQNLDDMSQGFDYILEQSEIVFESTGYSQDVSIMSFIGWGILLISAIVLLRMLLSKGKVTVKGEAEGVVQKITFVKDDADKKGKFNFNYNNNSEKIRHRYRKFLGLLYINRIVTYNFDTSESIHNKAKDINFDMCNDLEVIKNTYRKARYSSDDIDQQDLRNMKNAYKNLENTFKKDS